jgi:hypothetical protein
MFFGGRSAFLSFFYLFFSFVKQTCISLKTNNILSSGELRIQLIDKQNSPTFNQDKFIYVKCNRFSINMY